jgi:hypothetical protein
MAHKFEIHIKVNVNSSQDVTAEHLQAHLRQPDIQSRIRDVVANLLPPVEVQRRDVKHSADVLLVVVKEIV